MSDNTALLYAERIAYSSKLVLRFSYWMAQRYKDKPGVYVETGCAAGAQIIALALGGGDKPIYAFDSFQGIMMPSNRDNQMPGIRMLSEWEQKSLPDPGKQALISSGATVVPEDNFWEHIDSALGDGPYNITTVPGWFEETVPKWVDENEDIQISILRLDGDLYNSTYVCLKYLYPKCIEGACIIIDDIQLPGCKAACDDYFQSIKFEPQYQYVDNVAYFIKP